MAVQLNPDQERVVDQAIQAGLIRGAEDVVEAGIEAIRRRLETRQSSSADAASGDWSRQLHAWIHERPVSAPLEDDAIDREAIYGNRGA